MLAQATEGNGDGSRRPVWARGASTVAGCALEGLVLAGLRDLVGERLVGLGGR